MFKLPKTKKIQSNQNIETKPIIKPIIKPTNNVVNLTSSTTTTPQITEQVKEKTIKPKPKLVAKSTKEIKNDSRIKFPYYYDLVERVKDFGYIADNFDIINKLNDKNKEILTAIIMSHSIINNKTDIFPYKSKNICSNKGLLINKLMLPDDLINIIKLFLLDVSKSQ